MVCFLLIAPTLAAAAFAQTAVVIVDPTRPVVEVETSLDSIYQEEIDRVVLPVLKTKFERTGCAVDPEFAGEVKGSFTRKGADETIAFFQVCQTGNGLGVVAIVVLENGKVIKAFGEESGWTWGITALPDINQNGLNEFALLYGGGMHQGKSGVGVDIMEFSRGLPIGLGWFKAKDLIDGEADTVWKVTAKPGRTPVFYSQKYVSGTAGKWRPVGPNKVFKPGKAYSKFAIIN